MAFFSRQRADSRARSVPARQDDRSSFRGALIGSILFHAVVLGVLFFVLSFGGDPGSRMGGRQTESVGIVFVEEAGGGNAETKDADTPRDNGQEDDTPAEENNTANQEVSENQQTIAEERIGTDAGLHNDEETPMVTIHSGQVGTDREVGRVIGAGPGAGGGIGQEVGFGELKGKGKRFVYVLDRSESMRWPNDRPIRCALRQAEESIRSLDPAKGALRFGLVIYNHEAQICGNKRLMEVTPQNKEGLIRFLQTVQADGGTDPLTALEKAIGLKPDVIFFLTDADEEISPLVLAKIRELRLKVGVDQIHVMEFGNPESKRPASYRRLAEQNNGQYIYKDIRTM